MINWKTAANRIFRTALSVALLSCPTIALAQSVNSIPLSSLPQNSKLAIWGDSITEVTLYPQYTEMYLLACAGRTDIKVMTFGHSGETLAGLLNRQVDLQAFNPTVLSINYGMNDTGYSPYTAAKGTQFDQTMQQCLTLLKNKNITRIVAGPSSVDDTFDADDQTGFWQGAPTGGLTAAQGQNVNLSNFSAFGHTEAVNSGSAVADIYDRMNNTSVAAEAVLGSPYAYGAPHPEPNGHLMITYELLKTLACTGNIGTITVNMSGAGSATATTGQTVVNYSNGTVILDSTQYPFCYNYSPTNYQGASGLASVLPFLPFSQDLNRYMLVVNNLGATSANVTWGGQTLNFTSAQLSAGVNLAASFSSTPFDATFAQVMNEILNKDNFEDFEIKGTSSYFGNDNGGNVDNNMIAVQAQFDAAVKALIVPVRHTIVIVPTGASTSVVPVITGTMMGYPTVGQSFNYQVSALGSPSLFTASGLPSGLTMSSSGQISGTPTATGISVVTLTATNSFGTSLATHLTLNVQNPVPQPPTITSSLTASATVGVFFSYQIVASNNPTNYFVVVPSNVGTEPPNSSLPPGLTYNTTTGVFSGTPTTPGVYNVEISAMNAGGVTAISETNPLVLTISAAGGGAPPAPSGLAATAGSGQVGLSWSASAGAASYNVYRGTSAGGESTTALASGVTTTTYTDTTATNGTTYYYVVKAVNGSGTSAASNEASAAPSSGVPAAPTGLTAIPGNVSVTLSWTGSAGATTYNVYRGTAPGAESTTAVVSGIPELSYLDVGTGLSNGTTYYYVVKAVNSSGISSASNEISSTPTAGSAPAAPTGLTATAGNTQVSLNWSASSGATSYSLYRSTTTGGEGTTAIATGITATSYINTGLTNGTAYYYKVAAVNSAGTSSQSTEANATPAAASNIIANGTYQVVNLNSGLSLGAAGTTTGSQVQQQTYTGAATQQWVVTNLGSNVVEMAVSGTSEAMEVVGAGTSINNLLDITSYTGATNQQWTITPSSGYIEIVNVNSGLAANVPGWQTQSGVQLIQYFTPYSTNQEWTFTAAGGSAPAAPTGLSAAPGNGTAVLAWAASSGATSYNVYRGTSPGSEVATAIATGVTGTTYSDSSLTNGTTYYYEVKAVNANGTSGYSNEANTTPTGGSAPPTPSGLMATAASAQVTLSWTASTGATSYNVYRSTTAGGEGTTALVTGITTTSYINTGLTNGTAYYYKIAAVNSVGTSGQSTEVSATPTAASYIEPNGTYQVVNLNSSLSLGAAGTTTGSQVQQQTYTAANTQKWVVTNLGSNVVEMAVSGTSEAMEVVGAGTAINNLLDITSYTGATNQQWTITPSSGYIEIVNVNSGLAANVPGWQTQSGIQLIQYYTPYSTNQEWTFTALSGSAPAAPTSLAANAGNATVALSWTASAGATSYNIYRGTSAGGESTTALASSVTTTTYSDASAVNGTTYYYEVKAVNTNGTSGYSNEASATPVAIPAAPTGLTATAGNAQVSLSWTASTGATSYNLYRSTTSGGEGTTALVTGITTTSYTNTALTNGTTYYYKVAAVSSSGTSSQSTEASAAPTAGTAPAAPTGLTASAGNAQASLSWTASTGATSYNLYRGTSSGGEGSTAIVTGITTTTYTNTGLTNGTGYYYKVAAVNSYGTSGYSNEASVTPSATQTVIGVQYQTNGSALIGTNSAGVVSQSSWNVASLPYVSSGTNAVSNLVTSTGTTSGISESTTSCGGYDSPRNSGFTVGTGNADLYGGFALGNFGGVTNITVTLTGLTASKTYSFISYAEASSSTDVLSATTNVSGSATYYMKGSASNTFTQALATTSAAATAGNYFEFTNITGVTSVTFTLTDTGSGTACLYGFQLIGN